MVIDGVLLCPLDNTCTLTNELSSSDSSLGAILSTFSGTPANVHVVDLLPS